VLPAPATTNPIVAQVQGALGFAQLSFKAHAGKRVRSFSRQFGRSWAAARVRLQKALSGMIAKLQRTASGTAARIASVSTDCAAADLLNAYGSDPGGNAVKANNSASIDGVDITLGLDSSGAHLGINATVNGDTFKMTYDSSEISCLAYALPPCPNADGSLDAYGIKGKNPPHPVRQPHNAHQHAHRRL
jgi:hypothetical protein